MVFRLLSQETTMYFKDLSSSDNKSLKYRAMAKFIRYAHCFSYGKRFCVTVTKDDTNILNNLNFFT